MLCYENNLLLLQTLSVILFDHNSNNNSSIIWSDINVISSHLLKRLISNMKHIQY